MWLPRAGRSLWVAVALAAGGYLVLSVWAGWGDLVHIAERVGVLGALAVLALSLLNYGLRFLRWRAYLASTGEWIPWRAGLRIYLAGYALTVTPGNAGEAVRGVLLKQGGTPYSVGMAVFLSERLSDLLGVGLLVLAGLWVTDTLRWVVPPSLCGVFILLVLVARGQTWGWLDVGSRPGGRMGRALARLSDMLTHLRACHTAGMLFRASALSVLAWLAQGFALFLVLHRMGLETSAVSAIFIYASAMLVGALSLLPGGLGGTEAAMIWMLLQEGMQRPEAVAATVFIRVTTLWFAVAIGVGALAQFSRRV